jgi:choline dehydrogenase-like flavoprotein
MTGEIYSHRDIKRNDSIDCDVCIIGSGAGGGVLAEGLVEKGLDVVMLEAGQHRSRRHFNMDEATAFQTLYQERGLRATADLAIAVLQGATVGGGTTINWTSCFRTPERILELWKRRHGVEGLDAGTLLPHFEAMESRLSVSAWPEQMANANNRVILDGAEKLGWQAEMLRRNVKGCVNSGYCGMGCPVDGKQSMLVTAIPKAVEGGMRLYTDTRADRIECSNLQAEMVYASIWDPATCRPTGRTLQIKPKVVVSSCGAINGPALFLRSGLNDNGLVGRRTFLHPVIGVAALFDRDIDGFYGAPQSASCHQFIDRGEDRYGFFIETAPCHPILAATAASTFGQDQQALMARLKQASFLIALHVDGYLDGDEGGQVSLRSDGRIKLDYPVTSRLEEGFRASHDALARLALAAGADQVRSLHLEPAVVNNESELSHLEKKAYGSLQHGIFTAHQMGGLPMGGNPSTSIVNSKLQHHQIENLFVVDGSVFPTALGVNPSETIYGLAHRAREHVAGAV